MTRARRRQSASAFLHVLEIQRLPVWWITEYACG